nr:DUF4249 family protein [uncultured Carboxylicivirga sp.]
MKKIQLFILFIVLIGVSACEKVIELNLGLKPNFMVLNTVIYPDSIISCQLTQSNQILETESYINIIDADCSLFIDDVEQEKGQYYNSGKYRFSPKAEVGQHIRVEVTHPNYTSIEAEGELPLQSKAGITSMEIKKSMYDYSYSSIKVMCALDDPSGDDFYRLVAWMPKIEYDFINDEIYFNVNNLQQCEIASKDPVLNGNTVPGNEDFTDMPPNIYGVFDDSFFNGSDYNLNFELYNYSDFSFLNGNEQEFISNIVIDVQKISKDLYLYYKSVDANLYYGESPFSEPVKIHYNVSGGAGIVGFATPNELKYRAK